MQRLSSAAAAKLARIGRTETEETAESLRGLLLQKGMAPFEPVVEAFLHFGGYVLPIPVEGRFKIYRLKAAIRSRVGDGAASSDPQAFRIPFGQSETIQSRYELDGLGRLYEDDRKIADSAAAWIESWSKNP